jgi:serine/threonine protein kinase
MPPPSLEVPQIEVNFDTPNREKFLAQDFGNSKRYSVLGRGSYGIVIRAVYKNAPVAVKIVEHRKTSKAKYASLRNEANIRNLAHENIVKIIKIVAGDQFGLVIMERFEGHCLQYFLDKNYIISLYHKLL